ncbi:MAG: hypothetical protein KKH83_08345 [Candidatus Margulisbacteria bacterium]|nr:hypothetical protein [Candidatus Margulisiibacteriota bacterium]
MKRLSLCFFILLIASGFCFAGTRYTELTLPTEMQNKEIEDVHVIDSSNIWIVGDGGTVARSTDGQNFTYVDLGFSDAANWRLYSVRFVNDKVGFIVGKYQTTLSRIFKTTDGGTTWSVARTLVSGDIRNVRVRDSNTIFVTNKNYAVGRPGLYKSTDGGANWEGVSSITTGCRKMRWANTSVGWVVGDSGYISKTSDGGSNWSTQTLSDTSGDVQGLTTRGRYRSWVTNYGGGKASLQTTSDGGTTWTAVNTSTSANVEYNGVRLKDNTTGQLWGKNTSAVASISDISDAGSTVTEAWSSSVASSRINDGDFSDDENGWFVGGASSSGILLKRVVDPAITAIVQRERPSQSSVPVGFSGDILIKGGIFLKNPTVSIAGTGITVNETVWENPTQIRLNVTVASSAATGSREVTVQNWDVGIVTSEALTISALPTITSLGQTVLERGYTATLATNPVTVEGTGFGTGFTRDLISFGDGITVLRVLRVSETKLHVALHVASDAATGLKTVSVTNPDGGVAAKSNAVEVVVNTGGPTFSDVGFDGRIYQATWNSEDNRFILTRKPTLLATVEDTAGIDITLFKLFIIPVGTAISADTTYIDIPVSSWVTQETASAGGTTITTKGYISYKFQEDIPAGLSRIILYGQNISKSPSLYTAFIKVPSATAVARALRRRVIFGYRNGRYWRNGDGDLPFMVENDGGTEIPITITTYNIAMEPITITRTLKVGRNKLLFPAARLRRFANGNKLMVIKSGTRVIDTGIMSVFN